MSTDGSNDDGSSQLYPVVVRLFDGDIGRVVTQMLSIVDWQGPSTGHINYSLNRVRILICTHI